MKHYCLLDACLLRAGEGERAKNSLPGLSIATRHAEVMFMADGVLG